MNEPGLLGMGPSQLHAGRNGPICGMQGSGTPTAVQDSPSHVKKQGQQQPLADPEPLLLGAEPLGPLEPCDCPELPGPLEPMPLEPEPDLLPDPEPDREPLEPEPLP
jgi:hypothetical protein